MIIQNIQISVYIMILYIFKPFLSSFTWVEAR